MKTERERGVAEGNRIVNAQDEKRGVAEGNRIVNTQVGQEPNFPGIRLPWEHYDYSQETHLKLLRHWTVTAFLSQKKSFTKNRSVWKMPWHIGLGPDYMANFIPGWNFSSANRAEISARLLKQLLLKSNCRLHGEGFSPGRNSVRAKNPSPVSSNRARIFSPAKRAEKSI